MSSMEDFQRGFGNSSGGGEMMKAALEEGDLEEDGVWSVMKTTEGSKSNLNSKTRKKVSPASAWRHSAVAISSRVGGQAEDSAADFVAQHSSAPIDIPDWSKILKMKSKENLWDDDDDDACDYPNDHDSDDGGSKTHHVKNDDDDDDKMVPPHEYLARKLASAQIASFSMCEGVGRTLKGRDLSETRNAVLTKTGFLE